MLKGYVKRGMIGCMGLLVGSLVHANTDLTLLQPKGTISPFIFDRTNLTAGAKAYRPLFDPTTGLGDVVEYDVSSDGTLSTSVDWQGTSPENPIPKNNGANWSVLRQMAKKNQATYWQARKIIFLNAAGEQMPFRWESLSEAQKNTFYGYDSVLNYLRGDRANEAPNGEGYRARGGLLGDIIHGNLVYVGPPGPGYTHNDYADFMETHSNRAPRIVASTNDGMVHVFDADTGEEVFAYVPSMVISAMAQRTQVPFEHNYSVDGHLSVAQVFANNQWRTVLAGGLGAGGKGFFALDLTEPAV